MDMDEIENGEWIADGVLARLGSDLNLDGSTSISEPTAGGSSVGGAEEAALTFSSTESPKALQSLGHPTLAHSHRGPPLLPHRAQPERLPTVPVAGLNSGTWNRGLPSKFGVAATTNSGTPVISKSSVDSFVLDVSRPMTLPQHSISPRYTADRGRSASIVNSQGPTRHPHQFGRSWTRETSNHPVQGPFSSRTDVHSTQIMGDVRGRVIQATPSRPRAMQMLPHVKIEKVENNRLTSEIGNDFKRPASAPLSHSDLQKWPCRRCRFVHKGSDCEKSCIGCGSVQPDKHGDRCPFKDKVRGEGYPPLRRADMPQQEIPTGPKTIDPRVSATMQLSVECQRQGFNPEFKYYQGVKDGYFKASLSIKGVVITCGESSFATQKDARDALAPKGLEIVRKMSQALPPAGHETTNVSSQTDPSPVLARNTLPDRHSSSSGLQNFSTRQLELQGISSDNDDPIMDLIKSAQSPQGWGNGPANTLVSSTSNTLTSIGLSEQGATKRSIIVELPGNIESSTVRATVERAVAANPHTNISLHFPANVSIEIARAYGSAIGAIATSSHHRSRSRSPERELRQVLRARSRERNRQRGRDSRDGRDRGQGRGRYHRPAAPSVWPPRGMIDTYRPPPQFEARNGAEDSCSRLSPARESKQHWSYDRKEYDPRDRPARN